MGSPPRKPHSRGTGPREAFLGEPVLRKPLMEKPVLMEIVLGPVMDKPAREAYGRHRKRQTETESDRDKTMETWRRPRKATPKGRGGGREPKGAERG